MKNSIMKTLLIFIVFFLSCSKENVVDQKPTENTNEHFEFILYDGLNENIIPNISKKLEDNLPRVLDDLGVSNISKIKVKIWQDETNYLNAQQKDLGVKYPGSTGYVYGIAEVRILNRGNASLTVLHEVCHVISMYVNSSIPNNPRWLWEAVALYESQDFTHPKNISYLVQGNFPTLAELSSDFNSGNQKIYQVGYLLSEFIINTWGKPGYISIIKSNGNIQSTFGITNKQFEEDWKVFVTDKYLAH